MPGSLSFAKLVMMSSTAAKSAGDARYASQDLFIQSTLSHKISPPNCIRSSAILSMWSATTALYATVVRSLDLTASMLSKNALKFSNRSDNKVFWV